MLHLHILNTVNVLCAVGFMCLLLVPGWNIHLWCAEEILKIHCNPVYKMQDQILSPLFVRQRTSVPYRPLVLLVALPSVSGWPRVTLHSVSVQCYLEQAVCLPWADLCKIPPSLRGGWCPRWKQGRGLWIPPCLLGPLCHRQGLQHSGFCGPCRQSQLGCLKSFWTSGWNHLKWLFSPSLPAPVSQVV